MAFLPHIRYLRRRAYDRLRHATHLLPFLNAEHTRLSATPASKTVTPGSAAAAAAVGTLTFGANAGNGKVVTLGAKTYTFKTALTEVKASSTFTVGAGGSVIQDGDTLTINSKVYTWQTSLTNTDGHVLIGANDTAALLNMLHAINGGTGSGSTYAALTVTNTDVDATSSNATTLVIKAKSVGTAGNALTTAESSAGAWGSNTAHLTGGVAAVANEVFIGLAATDSLDNIIAASTAGSGVGSTYSTGTTANALATLAAGAGDTAVATAVATGGDGNYIVSTTDVVSATWSDTHLAGGSAATVGPNFASTTHGFSDGDGPVNIASSNGVTHVPAGLSATKSYWVIANDANSLALAGSREAAMRSEKLAFTSVGTGTITVKRAATAHGLYDFMRRNRPEVVASIADVDNFR